MDRLRLTPLIDVAFLVLIFFMALPLRRLDHKLATHLPKRIGDGHTHVDPEYVIRIHIHGSPAGSRYRLGDHRADRALDLQAVLRRLGPDNTYEIRADASVDWAAVVSMVDVLKGLDYTNVRFTGTRIPPEVRRLLKLPRPA
jgi:biopolymer transport protein ExbD